MNANPGRDFDLDLHLRLLVDHVPSMLAYWDRDLRCRFANRAYERWFGVSPESLIGTSMRDLLGPVLFSANEPYIRAALQGEQQVFERTVPGPGGAYRHSLATYVPDVQGHEIRGFIAHVTEVTQLKETEDALRAEVAARERSNAMLMASEKELREAQRLGQIGSWSWAAASDVTLWSAELFQILGWDPRQLPPSFARHPEIYEDKSWGQLKRAVSVALETGAPYTLELEYRRPDGGSGWVEARGEVARDESGAITGLRGTAQEISHRRHAEESRLRVRVLEEANLNKNALMSRVSHELRTPLNAILGFAELCDVDPLLSVKHKQWARLILESARHMLELVNEVLDISSAERGQLVINNVEFDVGSLAALALPQYAALAEDAGVTVTEFLEFQTIRMHSDPTRVKQVIDNLVSNAIKYTPAGGVVCVSLLPEADAIELTVSDTGAGLSAAQLERLFLPFERLGAEHTGIAGTGLGLALTKALVERLGGTIVVTSRVGVGSRFSVTLPLRAQGLNPAPAG